MNEDGSSSYTNSSMPGLPIPGGDGGSASVAVPAVLVALLLPAVQQAREAARRTQSKNNLKQMGLAMHNYHDTFNNFPEGTVPSDTLEPHERLSWMYKILPYLDQAPLYNLMSQLEDEGYASTNLETYVQTAIPVYNNPGYGPRREPRTMSESEARPKKARQPPCPAQLRVFSVMTARLACETLLTGPRTR